MSEAYAVSVGDVLAGALVRVRQNAENGADLGLSCGLEVLDDMLGGLQARSLTVAGAASRRLLESFAMTATLAVAIGERAPVLYCSNFVNRQDVAIRLAAAHSCLSWSAVQRGRVSSEQWDRLAESAEELAGAPIWIGDHPAMSMSTIERSIDATAGRDSACGLVIIDQLPPSAFPGHSAVTGSSARPLRGLASSFGNAVLALAPATWTSQSAVEAPVTVAGLIDHGYLAEAADAIVLLQGDGGERLAGQGSVVRFDVPLNRFGPTGSGEIIHLKDRGLFASLEP